MDIFNLDDSKMKVAEPTVKTSMYTPKYQDGKDNIYTSVIRFLPNPADPYNKSWVTNKKYWIEYPDKNFKGYVDSPKAIGEKCIIYDKYWDLHNKAEKGDARAKSAKAKIGGMTTSYYSYVLIVEDKQRPELEGQVLLYRYNKTIKKLIDLQEEPDEYDDEEKCNIFNPMVGKNFKLKIVKKSDYPNYDNCKFLKAEPIKFNGKNIKTNKEARKGLQEAIDLCQNLETQEYSPADDKTMTVVKQFLLSIYNTGETIEDFDDIDEEVKSTPKKKKAKPTPKKKKATPVVEELEEEEEDFDFEDEDEDDMNLDDDETTNNDDDDDDDMDFEDDDFDDFLDEEDE